MLRWKTETVQWILLLIRIISWSWLVDSPASVPRYWSATHVCFVPWRAQVCTRSLTWNPSWSFTWNLIELTSMKIYFYLYSWPVATLKRFITSSIRNQADYSPQLVYWLGGELANNRQFEWTDDTRMRFQVNDYIYFTFRHRTTQDITYTKRMTELQVLNQKSI